MTKHVPICLFQESTLYPVSHGSNVFRQAPDDWFVCLDNLPSCGSVCPWMAKSFMLFDIGVQQVWVLFSLVVQATNSKKVVRVENGESLKPQRWQWVCLNDLWWVCKPHYCLCSRSTPYFLSFSLKLLSAHRYWCPRKHNRTVWSLSSLPGFF